MKSQKFRDALGEVGLTQLEFAEHLGLHRNTVNRWASGELPVPKYAEAYLKLFKQCAGYARAIEDLVEIAKQKGERR